jgi:cell division protein FtsI (penicillin-binding protein 3)
MNRKIENEAILNRKNKIAFLYLLIVLLVIIFLYSILHTMSSDRRIPSNHNTIHDRSFRGSIISADGYTLSRSAKTYQAIIRGASIVPEKKALFIKLFSIYSGMTEASISSEFIHKNGKEILGNITISDTITSRVAMRLKSLSYKLRQFKVFRAIKNRNGIEVVYGLDIIENGESRSYPLQDILSPTLGYVRDNLQGRYTRPLGQKGLEKAYDKHITSKKNGYFRAKRDVVGALIHDNNSEEKIRVDGLNLHLNIPLKIQRRVELMLDQMKISIDAEEILLAIMESTTGKILCFATTKRYDPSHIKQKDMASLVSKFTEYPYEAGSIIKPLSIAIALDYDRITPSTEFKTGKKKFSITAGQYVRDDEPFKSMSVIDIIVHSSNIGTSQISWLLTGKEYRDGLLKFGLAQRTGIDLSRDLPGSLKSVSLLEHKMHRANSAFGYGTMVTIAQMLKAYSAFNNEGLAMSPRLVNYLEGVDGKKYTLPPKIGNKQAISKETAEEIHDMLLEVVKRGTGVKAKYKGLEVGGKTGTAHIAKNGSYVKEYHSSFFGFANDGEGNKYTIGALAIRAKGKYKYFASKSAVPSFRRALDILVELEYLRPEGSIKILPKIEDPVKEENSTLLPKIEVPTKAIKKEVKPKPKPKEKRKKEVKPKPKPKEKPKKEVKPKPKPKEKPKKEEKEIPKVIKVEKPPNYDSFEDMF